MINDWDEGGEDLFKENTSLKQILDGGLFPKSTITITSRPAPNVYPLLDKCKQQYSLVGFNDKQLHELFNRPLDVSQASNSIALAITV